MNKNLRSAVAIAISLSSAPTYAAGWDLTVMEYGSTKTRAVLFFGNSADGVGSSSLSCHSDTRRRGPVVSASFEPSMDFSIRADMPATLAISAGEALRELSGTVLANTTKETAATAEFSDLYAFLGGITEDTELAFSISVEGSETFTSSFTVPAQDSAESIRLFVEACE